MATWEKVLTTADDSAYKNSNVSGFLKDNANDTTSGTITAAGFTTTGTWTFDEHTSGTVGITTVQDSGTSFADNDTSLLTAGAIADYVTSQVSSGDITSVSLTGDSGGALSVSSGDAGFTIAGGTGVSTTGSGTQITIGLNDQLEDVAGMTANQTTALATISDTNFTALHGKGTTEYESHTFNMNGDGLIINDSTGQTAGEFRVVTLQNVFDFFENENWDFGGNVSVASNLTVTGNLTVNGGTTTISTTELTVEDKNILLGKPNSDFADDTAAVSANTGAGLSVVTDSQTANNYANLTWNTGKYLTGWCLEDTANNGVFEAAVMQFSTNSTAPSGNAAGVGSFHYDTGNDTLYIRTA